MTDTHVLTTQQTERALNSSSSSSFIWPQYNINKYNA